jgi:hypothetical protein
VNPNPPDGEVRLPLTATVGRRAAQQAAAAAVPQRAPIEVW